MPIDTRMCFATESIAIKDYHCHGVDTPCGMEESVDSHRLVVIRRGAYWRHRGSRRILADPALAIFDNAGEGYRVSHPVGGDDGTCITFTDDFLRDTLPHLDPVAAQAVRPFQLTHAATSPAVLLALQLFRQRARLGLVSEIDVEETALGVLAGLLSVGRWDGGQVGKTHPAAQRKRKETVEAVCLLMANDLHAPHSLTRMAQEIGCSPFHLTRIFRGETGMPMHRYLLWLRCAVALDRVASGEKSLSTLAFHLGFSSHSHFTDAFTRVMGMSPTAFRAIQ